jgi:glycosyltransferase involved in cell wall biosynthesis
MYVRNECLRQTGLFREDVFAQGYGEENDFCIRARHLGWRHVAVPSLLVAHLGGASFGAARAQLTARNLAVLERLHPGYRALIAAFEAADPLAEARRRIDALRWRAGRMDGGAVVMITHDSGGGVDRVVRERGAALRAAGMRPIVLRPVRGREAGAPYLPGLCRVEDDGDAVFPNLRYRIPQELPALARLLRAERVAHVEAHHLLGHDHAVLRLAGLLGVPVDTHLHDYALFCPRISLVGRDRRYCGEPSDPAVCEACVRDLGRHTAEDIAVASLRARSAADLAASRRVVVPSADAAARLRRHFPAVAPQIEPLEDDAAMPAERPLPAPAGRLRVAVIGGIGTEKGYDVLLACARNAAQRRLKLDFIVVGHTPDDARLIETGQVFVTGPYRESDAMALIRGQDVRLAWQPSIWPETWCFTLGLAWRAGLRVAAFDIGALAERIRRTGRGWLMPLGLAAPAINSALLGFAGPSGAATRLSAGSG